MTLSKKTQDIQQFIQNYPQVQELNEKEASDFYMQLIDCLVDHNHQYYVENAPIIADKEYDELFDYLKKIEEHFPQFITSNSPTQGLIGQVSEGFYKKEHEWPLLSLENTYNSEDLKNWDARINKILEKEKKEDSLPKIIEYRVEPKFDWLSIELIYVDWRLMSAITRWDWKVGEEIIQNVRNIEKLNNLNIKDGSILHVRWEIVMSKSVWKELNKEREDEWETPFANTRNAAAWSIKLLDSNEAKRRKLDCFVYDILHYVTKEQLENNRTQLTSRKYFSSDETDKIFKKYWLPVFPRKKDCHFISEVIDICNNVETKKYLEKQDIEFDWLVIKVKDTDQRESIWSTDHHPRWAVAYKFPAQLAATQILSVDFQVGRTWIITPVANLQSVQLSGAKLQRVSLHNFDFIQEKDIHLHDWIRLQRSGEVIPYIVSVITERRNGQEIIIQAPTVCPSCQQKITQKDIHYYCENPHCPEKIKQEIQHFVSKNCMDIQWIGESIVDLLVDNNIIENIADIYKLSDITLQLKLVKFPGIGDKKVAEIAKGIEESKHKALRRLLNGLWIPHVGKKMAQDIASQMNNDKWIINNLTDTEWLWSIYGIGEKSIDTISTFFTNPKNLQLLKQLENHGVNMDPTKYNDFTKIDDSKGNFSITWSFPLSRKTITDLFQQQGYIFQESPIKTTDFILIGDKASSKKAKAEDIWITLYEWREHITQQFPFLKNIAHESNKPQNQSLF